MSIGFLILSYNEPLQVLRLVNRLTSSFSAPPIICHHNFSQSALDTSIFPENVRFLTPHIQTGWGSINTVIAGVSSLKLLYKLHRPDWFFLLSGSDYPVASKSKIICDLESGGADAYIDCQKISPAIDPERSDESLGCSTGIGSFRRPDWPRIAFRRYMALRFKYPKLAPGMHISWENFVIWNQSFSRIYSDIRAGTRLFGGDPWFTGSADAAHAIINSPYLDKVTRYLSRKEIPEEAFYQTLLASSGLKINSNNRRYTIWPAVSSSPKWLTPEDLPDIYSSGAHFARKFKPNDYALDQIDRDIFGDP